MLLILALASPTMPSTALAQRGRPVQEFTRQGLLVPNFGVGKWMEPKFGRRTGDAIGSFHQDIA